MQGSSMVGGHRDLKVFQVAFALAVEIFRETARFPNDEKYSLTDQIRRASRSVAANIAEGFRKRRYRNAFVLKLVDADAEATEVMVWLDFASAFGYLSPELHGELKTKYEELGRMLGGMLNAPEKFLER
jgi:four helix bundle protein